MGGTNLAGSVTDTFNINESTMGAEYASTVTDFNMTQSAGFNNSKRARCRALLVSEPKHLAYPSK